MEVFFYGLFMDRELLSKNGVHASHPRKAQLDNYALKIGKRASLIPASGERAYGIVMSLEKDAVDKLYAEASVSDYLPEEVSILTESDERLNAICYNLPLHALGGTHAAYAKSLHALAQKLGFPLAYLAHIERMAVEEN